MYNPNPLRVESFSIKNDSGWGYSSAGYYASAAGSVYGSLDNVTWDKLCDYTNTVGAYTGTWTIQVNSTKYYPYHKITSTSLIKQTGSTGWSMDSISIAGYFINKTTDYVNNVWASPSESQFIIRAY